MVNDIRERLKAWLPPAVLQLYRTRREHIVMQSAGVPPNAARRLRLELPSRTLPEIFAGIEEVEVQIPAAQIGRERDMVMPLVEWLSVAAICRHLQPRRIFEIGTYTGSTTLAMALNTPPETEIWTLDLEEADLRARGFAFEVGSAFAALPCRSKIHQLRGDSRTFDWALFQNRMDLILVDADHAYEPARADTQNALQLAAPGATILWDDYDWGIHPDCAGVALCLNQLRAHHPVVRLAETRLALLQLPLSDATNGAINGAATSS